MAEDKFGHHRNIQIVNTRFEEWDAPIETYTTLISAQAYHWMPKELRMCKAAHVLKAKGHLALFWNMVSDMNNSLRRDLDEVYRRIVPEIRKGDTSTEEVIQEVSAEIRDSGHFLEPWVERFPWARRMDSKTYLGLIGTFSDHLRLPEGKRNSLFEAVEETIDRHGGETDQQMVAVLYLARK